MSGCLSNIELRNHHMSQALTSLDRSYTEMTRTLQQRRVMANMVAMRDDTLIDRSSIPLIQGLAQVAFDNIEELIPVSAYAHQYIQINLLNYAEMAAARSFDSANLLPDVESALRALSHRKTYKEIFRILRDGLKPNMAVHQQLQHALRVLTESSPIRSYLLSILYDMAVLDPQFAREIRPSDPEDSLNPEASKWIKEYVESQTVADTIPALAVQHNDGIARMDADVRNPQLGSEMLQEIERALNPLFDDWHKVLNGECRLLQELLQCERTIRDMLTGISESQDPSTSILLFAECFRIFQNIHGQFLEIKKGYVQLIIERSKELIKIKLTSPQQLAVESLLEQHQISSGIGKQLIHRLAYLRIMMMLEAAEQAVDNQHADISMQWIDILKRMLDPVKGESKIKMNLSWLNTIKVSYEVVKNGNQSNGVQKLSEQELCLLKQVPAQLREDVGTLTNALQAREDVAAVTEACDKLLELFKQMQQAHSTAFIAEDVSDLYCGIDELKTYLSSDIQQAIHTTEWTRDNLRTMDDNQLHQAIEYYTKLCGDYQQLTQDVRESMLGEEETIPSVDDVNELGMSLENLQILGQNELNASIQKMHAIIDQSQEILKKMREKVYPTFVS